MSHPQNILSGMDPDNILPSRSRSPTKNKIHSTRTSFSTNLQPILHSQSSFEIEDRPIEPASPTLESDKRPSISYANFYRSNAIASSNRYDSNTKREGKEYLKSSENPTQEQMIDHNMIKKLINDSIAEAIRNMSLQNPHETHLKPQPNPTQYVPPTDHQFHLQDTNAPGITKYNGKTDILQFLEDLDARYILQPVSHPTDRHKVIVAVEHLEGAKDDQTSDAPKEWARSEIRQFPELKDNWLDFRERIKTSSMV